MADLVKTPIPNDWNQIPEDKMIAGLVRGHDGLIAFIYLKSLPDVL